MSTSLMFTVSAVAAAGCESAARPQMSVARSAEGPKRPFSETPVLVKARRDAQADNSKAEDAPGTDSIARGGSGTAAVNRAGQSVPAGREKQQNPKETAVSQADCTSENPATLAQVIGWEVPVLPDSGGAQNPAKTKMVMQKKPLPELPELAAQQPTVRSGSAIPTTTQGVSKKGLTTGMARPMATEGVAASSGASAPTGSSTPPIPQVADPHGQAGSAAGPGRQAGGAADPEIVKSASNQTAWPQAPRAAKDGAPAGQVVAKKAVQQGAGSSVPTILGTGEPAKAAAPNIEHQAQESLDKLDMCDRRSHAEAPRPFGRDFKGLRRQSGQGAHPGGRGARLGEVMSTAVAQTDKIDAIPLEQDKSLVAPPELSVSDVSDSSISSQRPSGPAAVSLVTESPAAKGPAQSIGEQILDSVHASLARGERQLVIRLHPPELGSVIVRFGEDREQIHGVMEVSRSNTRCEVEQALPQMLRTLQDSGVAIRRFDVMVADQADRDLAEEQLQQDAWSQDQGSHRQGGQSQPLAGGRGAIDSEQPPGGARRPGGGPSLAHVPDDRIDMLV